MAEELAIRKANINKGKAIDENKLGQGTDNGGLKVHANISDHLENTHTYREKAQSKSKISQYFSFFHVAVICGYLSNISDI